MNDATNEFCLCARNATIAGENSYCFVNAYRIVSDKKGDLVLIKPWGGDTMKILPELNLQIYTNGKLALMPEYKQSLEYLTD